MFKDTSLLVATFLFMMFGDVDARDDDTLLCRIKASPFSAGIRSDNLANRATLAFFRTSDDDYFVTFLQIFLAHWYWV